MDIDNRVTMIADSMDSAIEDGMAFSGTVDDVETYYYSDEEPTAVIVCRGEFASIGNALEYLRDRGDVIVDDVVFDGEPDASVRIRIDVYSARPEGSLFASDL